MSAPTTRAEHDFWKVVGVMSAESSDLDALDAEFEKRHALDVNARAAASDGLRVGDGRVRTFGNGACTIVCADDGLRSDARE